MSFCFIQLYETMQRPSCQANYRLKSGGGQAKPPVVETAAVLYAYLYAGRTHCEAPLLSLSKIRKDLSQRQLYFFDHSMPTSLVALLVILRSLIRFTC